MKREVILFAEEFVPDKGPKPESAQSQVFVGKCAKWKHKIVIK
jgi:hypothetical protein